MRAVILFIVSMIGFSSQLAMDPTVTLPPWRQELPAGREEIGIVVGNTPVTAQLAISNEQQYLGLGYRNGLDDDTGMLFTGDSSRVRTFVMRGMRFCLDIIWIEDGHIVGAAESVCPDFPGAPEGRYQSPIPVTHVLEMPAGWLQNHGYGVGTPVDLSALDF